MKTKLYPPSFFPSSVTNLAIKEQVQTKGGIRMNVVYLTIKDVLEFINRYLNDTSAAEANIAKNCSRIFRLNNHEQKDI